jgi:hypothetical protein
VRARRSRRSQSELERDGDGRSPGPQPARGDAATGNATLGLQQLAGNRAVTAVVQRHAEPFRIKRFFDAPALKGQDPDLDMALSFTASALEFGKSTGNAVLVLRRALAQAGHAPGEGDEYDLATKRAVSALQADHGVPFPTGRQAGPKTLSALDAHLLADDPPSPDRRRPSKQWTLLSGSGLINTFTERPSIVSVAVELMDEFGSRATLTFDNGGRGPEKKSQGLPDPAILVIQGSDKAKFTLDEPVLAEEFGGFGQIFYSHAFGNNAAATAQLSPLGSVRFVPIARPLADEGAGSVQGRWTVFVRGPATGTENAQSGADE